MTEYERKFGEAVAETCRRKGLAVPSARQQEIVSKAVRFPLIREQIDSAVRDLEAYQ